MGNKSIIAAVVLLALSGARSASAILNGSVDATHPAVGVVTDNSGITCSAVLVAPRWVLTAASFGSAVTQGQFLVGADFAAPTATYAFSDVFSHPGYISGTFANDIALIRLTTPVTDVTPLPYVMSSSPGLGATVRYVGYGMTTDVNNTTRHACLNAVSTITSQQFTTDYDGAGPASGDNGGPALLAVDGQETVVGIISCMVNDNSTTITTRVSAYASWIQSVIAANSTPSGVIDGIPGARLLSVAPNPFNPRATIHFDLPGASMVLLSVYDVAGHLVRTLVDESLAQGSHEAVWDGRDSSGREVASGSFMARLESGGKVETRGLALVR